jgi:hypothetical protein
MHALRTSKLIARLVLAWFVLFLGSALASSVVHGDSMQLVCAGSGGLKLVDTGDADGYVDAKVYAGMDCPLCMPVVAPPAPVTPRLDPPSTLAHALQPLMAAHIASATAPPLPSRGPPTHLL